MRARSGGDPVNRVTSSDGTPITFDRLGNSRPVIVVGGQLCDRKLTHPTAEELAKHFTVFNYNRRGRGCSCWRGSGVVSRARPKGNERASC